MAKYKLVVNQGQNWDNYIIPPNGLRGISSKAIFIGEVQTADLNVVLAIPHPA